MMEEINILSQEREEIEQLARENQIEVEEKMNEEITALRNEHAQEIEEMK